MRIKTDGPYRAKKKHITRPRLCAIAIIAILVIGIVTLVRLDDIMTQQRIHDKTLTDAMDQFMEIRTEMDEMRQIEPEIVDSSEFSLTEDDRHLIERIVMAEARGGGVEGMAAVVQVIKNRSELWGMSVREVCTAPGQFAKPYQGEISPEAVQAVWAVFDEGMRIFEEPVTHFHAEYVNPYWTSGKACRGTVSGNRFYGEGAK